MEKNYCFFCKDLVTCTEKKVKENYSYRNKNFMVEETKVYCSKCGNEWEAKIFNRSNGTGCPYCYKNRITKDDTSN